MKLFLAAYAVLAATLVAAIDTAAYTAASRAAKTPLVPGHTYAFRQGGALSHQRLIVGYVTGTPGNYDFQADAFELFKKADNILQNFHGATCSNDHRTGWDCSRGRYKYLGETLDHLNMNDISMNGNRLIAGNDCYNVITNSCQTYVRNLFKSIKARSLQMESALLRREIGISERALVRRNFQDALAKREIDLLEYDY